MSEETILILIFGALGYVASFFAGYFVHKSRSTGLGDITELHKELTGNLTDSSERTDDIKDKLGGLVEAGRDVEEILRKYNTTVTESENLEHDSINNSDNLCRD